MTTPLREPLRLAVGLVAFASVIVILGAMMLAKAIVGPFLLAAFGSIIFSSPMFWLQKKGCPKWIAFIVVVLVLFLGGLVLGGLLGSSVQSFSDNATFYETEIRQHISEADEMIEKKLAQFGIQNLQLKLSDTINVGFVMKFIVKMLNTLVNMLANGLLIFIIMMFMLLEASTLPRKIQKITESKENGLIPYQKFLQDIRYYMNIKLIISLITGLCVYIFVCCMRLEYALLWALLAFILNFVPNIGSLIAMVPPAVLSFIENGYKQALIILLGYVVINFVMGNMIEPRWMGKGLGLSTMVVFVSLIFWGWILGPIGMLLAVPLMVMFKAALETNETTRWISIILGE
ncbi:hypothetical protein AB834_05770 [PVC group bacterium (ex Bugula neritina AB1)]|nr:hypothetical protein AB834_05770 [PVC group bacterium (ex Bugula neritina AB1)]